MAAPELQLHFEPDLPVLEDLAAVLTAGLPLIDTRSPLEFAQGALPTAVNLPLMDNQQRHEIGKHYKTAGQDAAIQLGLRRVSGELKAQRVDAWQQFVTQYPTGALYCFRGGLRSRITQQWLFERTGMRYPRIQGGYKALRRFVLEQLDTLPARYQALVLSGRTGSGKTILLKQFQSSIDLEGLANHRGSAFGPQVTPQPTQIDFENRLAVALLQQLANGATQLLFEDESRNIGSVHLPVAVLTDLSTAPIVMLEVAAEERAQISYQEYVVEMTAAFQAHHADPTAAFQGFEDYLLGSLQKIRRRLGGERAAEVEAMMRRALQHQQQTGETEAHLAWVRFILFKYYDPMYDYQISRKQDRLIFRGDAQAVRDFLQQRMT